MGNKNLNAKGWENTVMINATGKSETAEPGPWYESEMKPVIIDAKVFDRMRVERPKSDDCRELEIK